MFDSCDYYQIDVNIIPRSGFLIAFQMIDFFYDKITVYSFFLQRLLLTLMPLFEVLY